MGWQTDKNQDMTLMSLDGASDFFADYHDLGEVPTSSSCEASSGGFGLPLSIPASDMTVGSLDSTIETLASGSSIDTNTHGAFSVQQPGVNGFIPYSEAPAPAPTAIQPSRPLAPSPEMESQCVLACTQLISSLENYIIADLKALDIILGIIKKAVSSLDHLVSLQQYSCNFRSQMLFGVIMCQIITLLEVGCRSIVNNVNKTPQDPLSPLFGETSLNSLNGSYLSLPAFALGTFQIDANEQRSWRAQIVNKELQQTSVTLHRIMALPRFENHSAITEQQTSKKKDGRCLDGLDHRLKALIEAVRNA